MKMFLKGTYQFQATASNSLMEDAVETTTDSRLVRSAGDGADS